MNKINSSFTPEFLKEVTWEIRNQLFKSIDEDSVQVISEKICYDVARFLFEDSDYQNTKEYNDSDLRYAIGKALIKNQK